MLGIIISVTFYVAPPSFDRKFRAETATYMCTYIPANIVTVDLCTLYHVCYTTFQAASHTALSTRPAHDHWSTRFPRDCRQSREEGGRPPNAFHRGAPPLGRAGSCQDQVPLVDPHRRNGQEDWYCCLLSKVHYLLPSHCDFFRTVSPSVY